MSDLLEYESGQTSQAFEKMSDSGDATTFEASFDPISRATNPVVAPYGLVSGGKVTPTATNNQVAVAALTVQAPGMSGADADGIVAVNSGNLTITRATASDTHSITSITVDNSGALAAVAGTDGTSFSETRGADGGPPFIPVDSIEIAQVRTTLSAAAVVLAEEIFDSPGTHTETVLTPVVSSINYALGTVTFAGALPAIHTGGFPKQVWIKGATPIFATVNKAADWVPAENTFSVSSTDTYDGPVGSSSTSLGQASFSMILEDGISDPILLQKGNNIWFRYRADRDQTAIRQLTQGIFGVSRTNPAGGGSKVASCTITAESATVDLTS
ncbi:MAG: hypothetical protein AAGI72_23710 [Pseudomonadota bacterium]